jgi:hypothetical protein
MAAPLPVVFDHFAGAHASLESPSQALMCW